jgi:Tol biopolymer transport system component
MAQRFVNASVSKAGVLVYRSTGVSDLRQLTWFEPGKSPIPLSPQTGNFVDIALSPDGRSAAASMTDIQQNNLDIWTIDLAKALPTRFTFDKDSDRYPVWSPDGSRIVFSSSREGAPKLFWKAANGATNEEPLLPKTNEEMKPLDWSRDGQFLLFQVTDPKTKFDLWYLPMKEAERKPVPFLATEFNDAEGHFSPDGRFVAYASDESGTAEVYVRTFPNPNGKWQVSKGGGTRPRWRRDGKQIFYMRSGTQMMSVDVSSGATFQSGDPHVLFDARIPAGWDVMADGKRFLIATTTGDFADPITVVLNWQSALKK